MVYPVSGSSPQIQAATTFQPGNVEQRRPDEFKKTEDTRVSGTSTAPTQTSETRNYSKVERPQTYQASSNVQAQDNGRASGSSNRGTTLDISV